MQTQHRILRAALKVLGEVGYSGCRIERITDLAGISRPSFYQYFSSKEDLYRRLTGDVSRALYAITQDMSPVTADASGRAALRAWLAAHADLYEDYWPIFASFEAAERSDPVIARGASRVTQRRIGGLLARIDLDPAWSDRGEILSEILLNAIERASRYRQLWLDVQPADAPDRELMIDALTDILHRALFGPWRASLPVSRKQRAAGALDPTQPASLRVQSPSPELGTKARRTRRRLIDVAATLFKGVGFHDARVEDIVEAAGVSHGTFYRYFDTKSDIFRVIAEEAAADVIDAWAALPSASGMRSRDGTDVLLSWLRRYAEVYADDGVIFRVWIEAFRRDPKLDVLIAAGLSAIRRRIEDFLSPRGFGDDHADSFLLLALLDLEAGGLVTTRSDAQVLDATAKLIHRGFFALG